jgi:uncharacterized protein YbbC (DUF1343 family)
MTRSPSQLARRRGPLSTARLAAALAACGLLAAAPPAAADPPRVALEPIAEVIARGIDAGTFPGAVVVVGHAGRVVYRQAFGRRSLASPAAPMTVDTIFDLASLTKPIATATAIMQLVEEGRLGLDDPVANYWPEFSAHGKGRISVRDLLTHFSGLRPDLDLSRPWSGYETAIGLVVAERPIAPRGTAFRYSDVGFLALGELVRRISGLPLDEYCAQRIFAPLRMTETGFLPPAALRARAAATAYRGRVLRGQVHDPTAARAGGVAGHAGLFSSADDLARFAEMLLRGGSLEGTRILAAETVSGMTTPQTPPGREVLRGLGWDIDSPYAVRGDRFPLGSFGHTGFTGTSLWIDPSSRTYLILLSASVQGQASGRAGIGQLRNELASLVAAALATDSSGVTARVHAPPRATSVRSGLEVLAAHDFAPLRGLRIGLITNHSGIDSDGRRSIDLLRRAPGVELAAVFSPEHGLRGDADGAVASGTEPSSGLPLFSLYGTVTRPTDAMLEGLDALVFDIQDAGARFYTYITTLGYALEAAARNGLAFYVLDRPDPIGAEQVQGPLLDPGLESFTGYFSLPVRPGMTVGELARLFDAEKGLRARLTVIPMAGYRRELWYDETGLAWVDPSPNLRSLTAATLYPGIALVEGADVSVGRGTATPFELIGAPWLDGEALAAYLAGRRIPGVRFEAVEFTPRDGRHRNRRCRGVRIVLEDRRVLDSPALGVEVIGALWRLHADHFEIDRTLPLVGSRAVLEAIRHGQDPRAIARTWQEPLARFRRLREKYLLY